MISLLIAKVILIFPQLISCNVWVIETDFQCEVCFFVFEEFGSNGLLTYAQNENIIIMSICPIKIRSDLLCLEETEQDQWEWGR